MRAPCLENYLSGGNTYTYRFNRLDNRRLALETDHAVEYKRPGSYGMQLKPAGTGSAPKLMSK